MLNLLKENFKVIIEVITIKNLFRLTYAIMGLYLILEEVIDLKLNQILQLLLFPFEYIRLILITEKIIKTDYSSRIDLFKAYFQHYAPFIIFYTISLLAAGINFYSADKVKNEIRVIVTTIFKG